MNAKQTSGKTSGKATFAPLILAAVIGASGLALGCDGKTPAAASQTAQAPSASIQAAQAVKRPRPYKVVMPGVYPGAQVPFPPLGVFVQGEKRTAYAPGKVYVFEFFSTTCGHCAESAPVIEALVQDYTPKGFEFISVTAEDEAKVREWLAKPENADVVTQSLALDPGSLAQKALQDPTFQVLTPRFFVIRDGVVLWYGHPDIAEEPFAKIAAGSWDFNTVKQEFVENALAGRAKNQINGLTKECQKSGKWQDLLDLLESMAVGIPGRASMFDLQKFGTMIGPADMPVAGYAFGRELEVKYATDIASIRTLARTTLNSPQVKVRDLDWAFALAEKAEALGKGEDARAAEILALAYFSKGNREKAIEHQERAIALQSNAKLKKIYETQLAKFRTDEPKPVAYTAPIVPGASGAQAAGSTGVTDPQSESTAH